ncbi:hypothetical protein LUZ61_018452 [Rhynchospora tenuis]|uniref:ACB domain-containing protein n=1 Tax=Rhynchospora tenuis TaxID=198213 RepID=A0AAD5Z9C2_9POAL|nr:hypothetical protein LUZ61_018452 [Rhynchospora tenuis]
MGDWQDLGQAVFVGLIFSFLVAKLISVAISIKESNLKLTRSESDPQPQPESESEREASVEETPINTASTSKNIDERKGDIGGDDGSDDDSDSWEGIESTELDEEFSAASAFVATMAATSESARVSSEVQLKLYGLYKIATEGPCTTPQPSVLNLTARAKWNAWQRLGAMPTEEAMQNYISIVDELFPSWTSGSSLKEKKNDEDASASSSAAKGPMGPVFSSLIEEEEENPNTNINLNAIHIAAREGARDDLLKQLDSGVSVNLKEGEGRTPLHWAVDRGHLDIVKELLKAHTDVNAKDNEGQTPLHYAVVCEREAIAELLVNHGGDPHIIDNDGSSPLDLCDSKWPFMITE